MEGNHSEGNDECESDEDIAWVQCEKSACLKWRKISREIANSLGDEDPWYCHMNADTNHNSCIADQEPMKCPKGKTFVFSKLEKGTLVWARLPGYPRY